MGKTSIEWTDYTFNPWCGCVKVSPGCEHCYAEGLAKRTGHDVWGPQTERRFFGDKHWAQPPMWNRLAEEDGTRRKVFCASMADIMEDRRDLDGPRDRLFALIEETPALDWLLLTKRPDLYGALLPQRWVRDGCPSNVWIGFTAENQLQYDWRMPAAMRIKSRVRWISAEPLLGHIDFGVLHFHQTKPQNLSATRPYVDWIVFGGESGQGARPCALDWIRDGIRQCRAAGVAPFVKQLGSLPVTGTIPPDWKPKHGLSPDQLVQIEHYKGGTLSEWSLDLQVREWPR